MDDFMLWFTQFKQLVHELEHHWREGKTRGNPAGGEQEWFKVQHFTYGYPAFVGDLGGKRVRITIHEFDDTLTSYLKPGDRLECLRLSIRMDTGNFIVLRSRKWFDRLSELINVRRVAVTGNEFIDEQYRAEARSDEDRRIISLPDFHRIVEALHPFAYLTVSDSGCHVSLPIGSVTELALPAVLSRLAPLAHLAEFATPIRSQG